MKRFMFYTLCWSIAGQLKLEEKKIVQQLMMKLLNYKEKLVIFFPFNSRTLLNVFSPSKTIQAEKFCT